MTLPREWARGPQWRDEATREEWAPVLTAAARAWGEIELASLTEGVRQSALVVLEAAELAPASADCARQGLELTVLAAQGTQFRAAVHRKGLNREWHAAWGDDARVGELLGFPACCRDFFAREWVAGGRGDLTPAMRTVEGPWQANPMLRALGVRLVPHLPCSADCPETVAAARAFELAGRRSGADLDALEALLRLPVTYDGVNGVAVVETPHFRFMVAAAVSDGRVIRVGDGQAPPAWKDNGFSSWRAMRTAHAPVVEFVGPVDSALDLGCGDGALLAQIAGSGRRDGEWLGIEADGGRAERGAARRPGLEIRHMLIEDLPPYPSDRTVPFDVVLLMPGRLLEMPAVAADRVRSGLPLMAKRIVVYTYDDTPLQELAERAGLALDPVVLDLGDGMAQDGVVFRLGQGVQVAQGHVIGSHHLAPAFQRFGPGEKVMLHE